MFWNSQANRVETLSEGGSIVGQFPGATFKQGAISLHEGDRLFLFTDGLTEAADEQNHLFGRDRAEQVFLSELKLSPQEFCLRVKEWVDRYTLDAPADSQDDFTILQVRVGEL
jgi:serine phosphatase RsbU (regulator of sigma subunit)